MEEVEPRQRRGPVRARGRRPRDERLDRHRRPLAARAAAARAAGACAAGSPPPPRPRCRSRGPGYSARQRQSASMSARRQQGALVRERPGDDQEVAVDHVVLVQEREVGRRDDGNEEVRLVGEERVDRGAGGGLLFAAPALLVLAREAREHAHEKAHAAVVEVRAAGGDRLEGARCQRARRRGGDGGRQGPRREGSGGVVITPRSSLPPGSLSMAPQASVSQVDASNPPLSPFAKGGGPHARASRQSPSCQWRMPTRPPL